MICHDLIVSNFFIDISHYNYLNIKYNNNNLPLHVALPICSSSPAGPVRRSSPSVRSWSMVREDGRHQRVAARLHRGDRKSTRLNSSHVKISYAVFCLKIKILTYLNITI